LLKYSHSQKAGRVIDANLNRVKEGLRVCEEITRFILDSRALTAQLKSVRHSIDCVGLNLAENCCRLKQRDSENDVGRKNSRDELIRRSFQDIFAANIQRVKESIRVLEEFAKLSDVKSALIFKNLRYKIYEIEKKAFSKIAALSDFGHWPLRKKASK